jgi:hypothetical protein
MLTQAEKLFLEQGEADGASAEEITDGTIVFEVPAYHALEHSPACSFLLRVHASSYLRFMRQLSLIHCSR